MALPTSYTENELKQYMHKLLGDKLTGHEVLKWSVDGGSYDEIVNDALYSADVTDIATVTGAADIYMLRAYARRELWKAVTIATAGEFDYTHADSGATYKRSQVHNQAKAMLAMAESDLDALGDSDYAVIAYEIDYGTDDTYTDYLRTIDTGSEWSRLA